MFEANNDLNLIHTKSWNDGLGPDLELRSSRRQEAAANVKRQKVDAYESGSTSFGMGGLPGWIFTMVLTKRYQLAKYHFPVI